eukprot:456776-Lingulodinium_polyedra.AAC.1
MKHWRQRVVVKLLIAFGRFFIQAMLRGRQRVFTRGSLPFKAVLCTQRIAESTPATACFPIHG